VRIPDEQVFKSGLGTYSYAIQSSYDWMLFLTSQMVFTGD